jgi:hypothetical protein
MAIQLSTALRNARLDQIETTIGTSPVLKIYTGSAPGVANAVTGTLLATITLPSDWMANASGGSKALSGTWQTTSAAASGTPGYARLYESTATTGYIELDCAVGSGTLNFSANISLGGTVTISTFTLTDGNA